MICPHCEETIDDAVLAKHLGAKGGRAGKGSLTSAQAKKLVDIRERNRFAPGDTVLVVRYRKRARLVEYWAPGYWKIDRDVDYQNIFHVSGLNLIKKLGEKP